MNTEAKAARTLPWRDNIGYNIGSIGNALPYTLVVMYLTYFYTDYLKIGAAVAGVVFLVARIWDAINDPIMGYFVDKTHTRWGRFRPYILFGAVPLAVFLALTFYVPDIGLKGRIAWAFATYILLGMMQTLLIIPWYAQTVVITQDPAERSELAGVSAVIFQIGVLLVAALTIPLTGLFADDTGFFYVVIIWAVIGTIAWYVSFVATKKYDRPENYPPTTQKIGVADIRSKIKVVFTNKPFVFVMMAMFFNFAASTMTQASIIYFFKYYLRMEWLFGPIMGGFALMTAVGAIVMSMISRKKGKRKIYLISSLGFSFFLFLTFLGVWIHGPSLTYQPIFIIGVTTLSLIAGFFNGPVVALIWSMMPDTVEYSEWKTGIRSEGVLYSVFSFIMKTGAAVGGALTGFMLAFFNYVPDQIQTDYTLFGITLILYIGPALLQMGAFIMILFYDLDEDRHRKIVAELKQRRNCT